MVLSDNMANIFLAKVESITDSENGGRIKARVLGSDLHIPTDKIPWAFPLMPKLIHILPKVGEAVLIICSESDKPDSQRYYIGPITSIPQNLFFDGYDNGATGMLKGGVKIDSVNANNKTDMIGAFAKDGEVAIYGRKNTDIILSDNDVRIRCGNRLSDSLDERKISFNRNAPAFIKLKYNEIPIKQDEEKKYNSVTEKILSDDTNSDGGHNSTISTATVFADKINLLSPSGDPYVNINDREENISDDTMRDIINKAHQLPYGDVLVEFLYLFLQMFKSHTHKYHNMEPCPDAASLIFDANFGSTRKDISNKILSNNIRIN